MLHSLVISDKNSRSVEVWNSAPTPQQQHWLNPKLGAEWVLASSDHASLQKVLSAASSKSCPDPVIYVWPFLAHGQRQSHRSGSHAFSRRHGKKLSSAGVRGVQTQRQKQAGPRARDSLQLSRGGRQQPHRCEQLGSPRSWKEARRSPSAGVRRTPLGWLETTNPKSSTIVSSWWRPSLEESKGDCLLSSSNIKAPGETTLKHNDHEDNHDTVP